MRPPIRSLKTTRRIRNPSPVWLTSIGKPAAAKMIHPKRTGSGQKPSFATGSLPPQPSEERPMSKVMKLMLLTCCVLPAQNEEHRIRNIVLVHGAWADGSGWRSVYNILIKDGYQV